MGLVRREMATPWPAALRVDKAQLRVRLAKLGIGITDRIANGCVREGAAKQEAEEAIGPVVVALVGQSPAAFETAVEDRAVADAGSGAKAAEPGDVGAKRHPQCGRR